MRRRIGAEQPLGIDLGVFLRCRQAGMAQQFLDRAQIGARAQKLRGKRMAQRVRRGAGAKPAEGAGRSPCRVLISPALGDVHMNLGKETRILFGLAIALFALAGCAEAPLEAYTASKVHSMDADRLCIAYFKLTSASNTDAADLGTSKQTIRSELTARGAVPQFEWRDIKDKFVSRGLHRCSVLAILGSPLSVGVIRGPRQTRESWTYDFKGSFVELTDGTVSNYNLPPKP